MDISRLLDGLNDRQREAVGAPLGNYLVLAGAGSGKTRVLTHRVAWLVEVEGIAENRILAVTFTNKAAGEMRHRIQHILHHSSFVPNNYGVWVGTFHSIANRILRTYATEAGLPQDFQIMDAQDQNRLLKRLLTQHNYDLKIYPEKSVAWFINYHKEEGRRWKDIGEEKDPHKRELKKIYRIYQEYCDRCGVLDFAELLLRLYELLRDNPAILRYYQQRFTQILVDEFQDTNSIQYLFLHLLAGETGNLMVVGDDDQSIYGWRGAKIENMQRFCRDYSDVQTIRLEQNYRSTGNILKTANALIAHNDERMGKNLWTADGDGEKISVYEAFNEHDEALFVSAQIEKWRENGGNLRDCAVLYRNNHLSRVMEEALIRTQLPYRIYGGVRFFERQEIKDILAYLRLMANPKDDVALERVINTPARGIGARSLDVLRQVAREQQITLWQALHIVVNERHLAQRACTALMRFAELIEHLREQTSEMPLGEQTDFVIKNSGIYQMYEKEKGDSGEVRLENLDELVAAAHEFKKPAELEDLSDLTAFLTHASLEAGEAQADTDQDAVQLMTLHSAKGLEFDNVFIVGVEQGTLPSQRSVVADDIQEERRLMYVGITRAKQQLTLSCAESRRTFGAADNQRPSQFFHELPKESLNYVRVRTRRAVQPSYTPKPTAMPRTIERSSDWKMSDKVRHSKFGTGTIINLEGEGEHLRMQVAFQGNGIKWLVARMANLEKI